MDGWFLILVENDGPLVIEFMGMIMVRGLLLIFPGLTSNGYGRLWSRSLSLIWLLAVHLISEFPWSDASL